MRRYGNLSNLRYNWKVSVTKLPGGRLRHAWNEWARAGGQIAGAQEGPPGRSHYQPRRKSAQPSRGFAVTMVDKPMLGGPLLEAVQAAFDGETTSS